MENKKQQNKDWLKDEKTLNAYVKKYMKIAAFSFFLPLWLAITVNHSAIFGKIAYYVYYQLPVFDKHFIAFSLTLFFFPLIYLFWFYYLSIQKTLQHLYDDFLKTEFQKTAVSASKALIAWYSTKKDNSKFDINVILVSLNKKMNALPSWLQFVAKKMLVIIPFKEIIFSYDAKDLEQGNETVLANAIEKKINDFVQQAINDYVPQGFRNTIPFNILFIILYFWT